MKLIQSPSKQSKMIWMQLCYEPRFVLIFEQTSYFRWTLIGILLVLAHVPENLLHTSTKNHFFQSILTFTFQRTWKQNQKKKNLNLSHFTINRTVHRKTMAFPYKITHSHTFYTKIHEIPYEKHNKQLHSDYDYIQFQDNLLRKFFL